MVRIPAAFAHALLALCSLALFHGSTCAVAVCVEQCDPCFSQCLCHHTCSHTSQIAFEPAHRLVAFERIETTELDGSLRTTLAWIGGLSVARATGRPEASAHDLREFAEGVIGVNQELLELDAALGHWKFGSVELAGEFALVRFERAGAGAAGGTGELLFVFDAQGKLLEIDRVLTHS